MAAKFTIQMDTLHIDPTKLSFNAIKPTLQRAMFEILADHAAKQGQGKAPDGARQKANSPGYAKQKATKGIRVGSRLIRGNTPTVLTGELLGSRQVQVVQNEVRGVFTGQDNAKKARSLVAKGYKIHYFSQKNIDALTQRVAKELDIKGAIQVRRA